MNYNYSEFDPKIYPYTDFQGPKAGQSAIDFELETSTGDLVTLSKLRGKTVVLETGSISCPMYVRNIPPMNEVAAKFPNVEFFVLYIREAHPGSKIPLHSSMDDKRSKAQRVSDEEPENRCILIDGLDGAVHQSYGAMPNMVYVISPLGKVRYRSDWSNWQRLIQVLTDPDLERVFSDQHFEPAIPDIPTMFRVLWRAGWKSAWHILKHSVQMKKLHQDADRVFADVTSPKIL